MNSRSIASAVMAACMGLSGLAVAQQDKNVRSNDANRLEHMGRSPGGERPDARRGGPPPRYVEQDRGRDHNRYRDHARDRDRGPGAGGGPPPRYVERDRGRDHDRYRDHARNRDRGPGAGPEHNFYRGGRLPPQYRSSVYVVDDWRGHRLTHPPRGYHWVQTGGDYVLVAVATGIIASILLNH